MSSNRKILMLPGDGIGPEVMSQTKLVINWFDKNSPDVLEHLLV